MLDDGNEVRLVGALAARRTDGGGGEIGWPPEKEAHAELERLALGQSIELGYAGRRTDRYGRVLAQVFVRRGEERVWLQQHMLRAGYARAYVLPGSTACQEELAAAERAARDAGIGVWSNAAYQVRAAERTRELARFRSTYQIVEGRVLRAADVRGNVFLNFGNDWRDDFTASVRPAARREMREKAFEVKMLEGRRVRIRGWVEWRSGPSIEIHHPGQIEVLSD